jgi:hypothetical protein
MPEINDAPSETRKATTAATTRFGDDEVKRFVRWYAQGKKKFVAFGQTFQTMVPNPTFNPVTKPGIMHKRLRELAEGGERKHLDNNDRQRWGGQIERLSEHYQDRDARLRVMDEQGVDTAWLFPTLAVGVEGLNPEMVQMTYKLFHSFNRWLEEDWGWSHRDRIISTAAIPVLDPVEATKELDSVLERGARLIVLRPGPANGPSPADLTWDPFWARVQEADVPVTYHVHGGDDAYDDAFRLLWRRNRVTDPVYDQTLRMALFGGGPDDPGHGGRPGVGQSLRPVPQAADRHHRARLCLGSLLPAHARPRRALDYRPSHRSVRTEVR